jgi:hypothetical protein
MPTKVSAKGKTGTAICLAMLQAGKQVITMRFPILVHWRNAAHKEAAGSCAQNS